MGSNAVREDRMLSLPQSTTITAMLYEDWRRQGWIGIGSSDCAAILGLTPYRTPLDVYLEKIGELVEQRETLKTRFGIEVEPIIARMFEQKTGLTVRNDFKVRIHPVYPFLVANLDRVVVSHNGRGPGILEIKTASEAFQKGWEDEIPVTYYVQIQHQMMVTGYQYGYVAILFFGYTGVKDFQVVEVERDNEYIENTLQPRLVDFWNNHVIPHIPPEPINAEDLKILYPRTSPGKAVEVQEDLLYMVKRLKELRAEIKPLEEEKEQLEEQIKLAFRDAEVMNYKGFTIATYKQSKDILKFNQKQFEAENPELARRYYALIPGSRRLLIKIAEGE